MSIISTGKNYWSILAILFIAIFWSLKVSTFAKWESLSLIQVSDVRYFYIYLPAAFIYDDLTLQFTDDVPEHLQNKVIKITTEDGHVTSKALMGVSLMYSPFFFMAHLHAGFIGGLQDGYSGIYEHYLAYSGIFWALIGFLFLRKVLLKYFDDRVVATTFILLSLGTNLYYYATGESMMSHIYSFSMACIFLYLTLSWNEKETIGKAVTLGALGGLIFLIRPTNATVFLLPVYFWILKIREDKEKLSNLLFQGFLISLAAFLILLPQLLFWKIYGGSFIIDTYGEERFHFGRLTNIVKGLFSYKKGWLVYTPLMALSLIGFYFFRKQARNLNRALLLYFVLTTYIIFSWYSWWYGGSFGSRAMVDTYAFLSLPLAAFLKHLWDRKSMIRYLSMGLIIFLIYLNLFQTRQYREGFMHFDGMTKESYWAIFLSNERPENLNDLFERPDYRKELE